MAWRLNQQGNAVMSIEMPDDCPMYDATSNARDRKEFKLELYAEMWHQTKLLFCTLYLFDLVSEPSHSHLSWELHSMGTPKYLATFSPVKSIGIQLLAKDMPLEPCRTLNACSIMQPNSNNSMSLDFLRAFDMIPRYEQHFCHFSCKKDWLLLKLREPEYLKQRVTPLCLSWCSGHFMQSLGVRTQSSSKLRAAYEVTHICHIEPLKRHPGNQQINLHKSWNQVVNKHRFKSDVITAESVWAFWPIMKQTTHLYLGKMSWMKHLTVTITLALWLSLSTSSQRMAEVLGWVKAPWWFKMLWVFSILGSSTRTCIEHSWVKSSEKRRKAT